jgi:hypothetical protein
MAMTPILELSRTTQIPVGHLLKWGKAGRVTADYHTGQMRVESTEVPPTPPTVP